MLLIEMPLRALNIIVLLAKTNCQYLCAVSKRYYGVKQSQNASVLSHNFGKIAKRAGLQGVRFHDLRHTFASLMLLRGVPAKVISEALGHASVAFTMDTYSHIMQGMQSDAMAVLDEVLPVGKNGAPGGIYAKFTPIPNIMVSSN